VGTGQGHVCGIRQPGTLWCWGRNIWGQLGQGSVNPQQIRTPTQVGTATDWTLVTAGQGTTCGLRGTGSLWCWGDNSAGQLGQNDTTERDAPAAVGTANDWATVSVDTFHGCGIRPPGTLWCWGRNVEGQLGIGDYATHLVPTRAGTGTDWIDVSTGRFHTCALRADASIWCTGDNPKGQLGTGNSTRINAFAKIAPYPP
jgi:alpha-tubulin suppressor-like RCC1 family protein